MVTCYSASMSSSAVAKGNHILQRTASLLLLLVRPLIPLYEKQLGARAIPCATNQCVNRNLAGDTRLSGDLRGTQAGTHSAEGKNRCASLNCRSSSGRSVLSIAVWQQLPERASGAMRLFVPAKHTGQFEILRVRVLALYQKLPAENHLWRGGLQVCDS